MSEEERKHVANLFGTLTFCALPDAAHNVAVSVATYLLERFFIFPGGAGRHAVLLRELLPIDRKRIAYS